MVSEESMILIGESISNISSWISVYGFLILISCIMIALFNIKSNNEILLERIAKSLERSNKTHDKYSEIAEIEIKRLIDSMSNYFNTQTEISKNKETVSKSDMDSNIITSVLNNTKL